MPVAMSLLAWSPLILAVLAAAETLAPAKGVNATGRKVQPHEMAALQRSTLSHEPKERRHFLDKHDLKPIDSIRCLQEKQRHPDRPCTEKQRSKNDFREINLGHFPSWQDPVCHSNQEFFCDPSSLLKQQEEIEVQQRLQLFKERTMVNCGTSVPDDVHSSHWYDEDSKIYAGRVLSPWAGNKGRLGIENHRPFNLAVVVIDEWASSEMDAKSVEYLGRLVMTKWGLMPIYNGVDNGNYVNEVYRHSEYFRNCPNTAVLFVLPRYHEAFLSSPSCEFICPSKGGPEVVASTLAALDRSGLQAAINAGIDEVGHVLQKTAAVSGQKFQERYRSRRSEVLDALGRSDAGWVWAIRFLYACIIAFAVFIVAAFTYYFLQPEKALSFRSTTNMNSAVGRRAMTQAFMQG